MIFAQDVGPSATTSLICDDKSSVSASPASERHI